MKSNFCIVLSILFFLSNLYSSITIKDKYKQLSQKYSSQKAEILYYVRLELESFNSDFIIWDNQWEKWIREDPMDGMLTEHVLQNSGESDSYNNMSFNPTSSGQSSSNTGQLSIQGKIREEYDARHQPNNGTRPDLFGKKKNPNNNRKLLTL